MATRWLEWTTRTSRVSAIACLRRALPGADRCERPVSAEARSPDAHPGILAQGPEEKRGFCGRTAGFSIVIRPPSQMDAPRWGGVSRGGHYNNRPGWSIGLMRSVPREDNRKKAVDK